jgi:hypothetical protein
MIPAWLYSLDPIRQAVITEIRIDRLNEPIRTDMQHSNWIGAAFEILNSRLLLREIGEARCKDLAYALEYGKWR